MTSSTAGPPLPPGGGAAPPPDLLTALRAALGDTYDVERLLGAGGMGSVFLGRDRTLDREVAIKVIAPELAAAPSIRERFLHEARTVARLRHPNIVAVYAAGEAGGVLYFVMEFVPGESLRDRLARDGRFDDRQAVAVLRDLARALAAAHAHGVVHRDVKPENVLLEAGSGRAMLTDFGVARAFAAGGEDGRLTGTGFVLGSPKYMSPEQAAGERELDGRSDVYSLGLVAYEMFAGEAAVSGGSAASLLVKQLTEKPAPVETKNAGVPPAVAAVIERALEKSPDARFATADAMADALDLALDAVGARSLLEMPRAHSGLSGASAAAAAPNTTAPPPRRRRLAVAAGVVAVMLGAAVAGGLLARGDDVPDGVDPRRSYLVAPFEVQSGDPQLAWLREGSANMLSLNLAQWQDLEVVEYERGLDLLRDLELDGARRLSLEDARRLARRAGAWTVVMGQVSSTPDSLLVTARLYAVETGRPIDEPQGRAAPKGADPRALFDGLARDLLNLAGAPSSVAVTRLATTTTSSVAAYRDYLEGVRALNGWQLGRADSLFANATRLDSTFALAYYKRALTRSWSDPGDSIQYAVLDVAARHARRLPERERALLEAYRALAGGFAAAQRQDTTAVRAGFAAAQQQYAAIVARDSGDAEAWYGLGDAYWHDTGDGPYTARNWTRALRAFNRTLALDSSFHLAYQHKLNTYQSAAMPNSWFVLDGDSVRVLATDVDLRAPATAAAKQRAQQLAVREARGWVAADPVQQAYVSLAGALATTRQFDSAAAVLTEAMARPELRRGTLPFMRVTLLTRVDPAQSVTAMREALRAADARAIAAGGGGSRAWEIFGAAGAAAYSGSVRDMEALSRLAVAAQPKFSGSPMSTAEAMRWYETAAKLAMGVPPGSMRGIVDSAIRGFDRMTQPYAPQMRQQSAPVLFTMYLATRDPKYADTFFRWRGLTTPQPELDALKAIARGDTAAARQAAALFPSPDSARAAKAPLNAVRWVARAEALTALGDPRRAVAMYEVLDPAQFDANMPIDVGLPLYARSFLARGRLYEELGERQKAAESYERFLTIWKDADPQFQGQLREARAGLARVKDAAGGRAVGAG